VATIGARRALGPLTIGKNLRVTVRNIMADHWGDNAYLLNNLHIASRRTRGAGIAAKRNSSKRSE
jgi:hypothetical protein